MKMVLVKKFQTKCYEHFSEVKVNMNEFQLSKHLWMLGHARMKTSFSSKINEGSMIWQLNYHFSIRLRHIGRPTVSRDNYLIYRKCKTGVATEVI